MVKEKETIVVTGAAGFIGSHVVDQLLRAGYAVRGTVRADKAETLRGLYADKPDFEVFVVDDVADSDMSAVLKGADGVISIAYHTTRPGDGVDPIDNAMACTMNILRQAHSARAFKFVAMSTMAAAIDDLSALSNPSVTLGSESWCTLTPEQARDPATHPISTYGAAKAIGEQAAWDFAAAHPEVDLTTLLPCYTYGPLLPTHIIPSAASLAFPGTPGLIYTLLKGSYPWQGFGAPVTVDVRDVARAAVLTLSAGRVEGRWGKRLLLWGSSFEWAEAVRHIRKVRPEVAARLPDPDKAPGGAGAARVDVGVAERVLGMREWVGWRSSVEALVDGLLEREKGWEVT